MGRMPAGVVVLLAAAAQGATTVPPDRRAVVRALLERSRLLEHTHFQIPVHLWRQYTEAKLTGFRTHVFAPVDAIPQLGRYRFVIAPERSVNLEVTLRVHVFNAFFSQDTRVLSADLEKSGTVTYFKKSGEEKWDSHEWH